MNMLKRIISIMCAITILIPFSTAYAEYDDDYRERLINLYRILDEQMANFELTEEQDFVFDTKFVKVANRDCEVEDAIAWNDARKVMAMVIGKHPRFLSTVNNIGSLVYDENSPGIITGIDIKRIDTDDTYENVYNRLDEKADKIISEIISDEMSELEKAYAVYVYFMKNYTFSNDTGDEKSTIYGVLEQGAGDCGGFANTYKMFMSKLGISCYIANSRSIGHLWNYVKVENSWFEVDSSWGVSGSSNNYFMMTTADRQADLAAKYENSVYDWECIFTEVQCVNPRYKKGYIFRNIGGTPTKTLTYKDGNYCYEMNGMTFINCGLEAMKILASMPVSEASGEIADIAHMEDAYSIAYGAPAEFTSVVACYDENGVLLQTTAHDIQFKSDRKVDVSCKPPVNTAEIKIYMWDGINEMSPLSQVTEVRN